MLLGQLSVNGHWLISLAQLLGEVYIGKGIGRPGSFLGEPVFEALFEYENQS